MARTTEEVLITFKTDTQGIEEADKAMQKQTTTVNQANVSFGSLFKSIIGGIGTFFTLNLAIRSMNFLFLKSNRTINNLTFNTIGFAKTIVTKLLPAMGGLIAMLGLFAVAAIAAFAAFKVFITTLKTTESGVNKLAVATTAMKIVWADIIRLVTSAEKAADAYFASVITGILTAHPLLLIFLAPLAALLVTSQGLVDLQEKLRIQQKEVIEGEAERVRVLNEINRLLKNEELTTRERIPLLKDKLQAQTAIDKASMKTLVAERNFLTEENRLTGVLEETKRKNLLKISKIKRDLAILQNNITLRAQETKTAVEALRKEWEAMRDFSLEPVIEEDEANILPIRTVAEELAEQAELNEMVANALKKHNEDEAAEEQRHQDNLTEIERVAIKGRADNQAQAFKVEQKIDALKRQALSQFFQFGQQLAGDNQELRGVIMIAEAIANTALGITAATSTVATIPLVPWIAAIGALQVATIAAQMGNHGATAPNSPAVNGFTTPRSIETASPDFFRTSQFGAQQTVLVVEDLNTTQGRINVTNERASLGG